MIGNSKQTGPTLRQEAVEESMNDFAEAESYDDRQPALLIDPRM